MPRSKHRLLSAAQERQPQVTAFLQDLIRIPSINGRDPEISVARRVVEEAERLRLTARLVAADPQRPNVLVELGQGPAGFALIGHLDTVAEGEHGDWQYPPFGGEIHDGWLYGRGAADNKAGVACALYTLAILRDLSLLDLSASRVILAGVTDEESGANSPLGLRHLLDQGLVEATGAIYTYAGDKIFIGHRGVLRVKVRATGEAIHTGRRAWHQKRQGINAGTSLMPATLALDNLDIPTSPHPAFPGLGCTVTVTSFHCGDGDGVVPARAEAGIDVRLMPGQRSEDVLKTIRDVVEAKTPPELPVKIDVTVDIPAAVIPADHRLVELARHWTRTITGKEWPAVGAGPANEGYMLIEAGVPTLCGFGPRGENAHARDERVELASLSQAVAMYVGLTSDYLSAASADASSTTS
jgi:succinyl-diaminopimelate desuccinylase